MYLILIEWGGQKPPSSWYKAFEKVRRFVTVYQEGCLGCRSESLARYLSAKAKDTGANQVSLAEADIKPFKATPADRAVLGQAEQVFKKGRPWPKAWVVSCLECLQANQVSEHHPFFCPDCGSCSIAYREGNLPKHKDPGGSIFTAWLRTRFGEGGWEPATWQPAGYVPPSEERVLKLVEPLDRETVALLNSPELLQSLPSDRGKAAHLLDALFVVYRHSPDQIASVRNRVKDGGKKIDIAAPYPILVDAGIRLGMDYVQNL